MRKTILAFSALLIVAAVLISPRQSSAQITPTSFLIGPHIGFGGWGGTSFGANAEKIVMKAGELGPGMLGISGRFDYSSFDEGWVAYNWTYTLISIGVFGNYHFKMENDKLDPFVSLGLAYEHWGVSGPESIVGYSYAYSSGIQIAGNAGIRYFFSPAMAARAQVGFGLSVLVLGLDFGI